MSRDSPALAALTKGGFLLAPTPHGRREGGKCGLHSRERLRERGTGYIEGYGKIPVRQGHEDAFGAQTDGQGGRLLDVILPKVDAGQPVPQRRELLDGRIRGAAQRSLGSKSLLNDPVQGGRSTVCVHSCSPCGTAPPSPDLRNGGSHPQDAWHTPAVPQWTTTYRESQGRTCDQVLHGRGTCPRS